MAESGRRVGQGAPLWIRSEAFRVAAVIGDRLTPARPAASRQTRLFQLRSSSGCPWAPGATSLPGETRAGLRQAQMAERSGRDRAVIARWEQGAELQVLSPERRLDRLRRESG